MAERRPPRTAARDEQPDAVPRTRLGRHVLLRRLRWERARLQKEVHPLLQPHLGRSEFRTIYTGVGAAMVVAGIAVMANWVSIVQATARPNALRVAGAMFYVGLGVAALGVYCFVASMSDSLLLWLPGKGPMIRAAKARAIRERVHSVAVSTLASARVAGLILSKRADLTVQQAFEWQGNVAGLGMTVWGGAGMQLITLLDIDEGRHWTRGELVSEVVDPALLSIEAALARVESSQIEHVDLDDVAALESYHRYFSGVVREFFKRRGGADATTH
jgi:hypothetical protein